MVDIVGREDNKCKSAKANMKHVWLTANNLILKQVEDFNWRNGWP